MRDVKRSAAPHACSNSAEGFFHDLSALLRNFERWYSFRHKDFRIAVEIPIEESFTAISQTIFRSVIGTSHEAIQRHGHIESNFSHVNSPLPSDVSGFEKLCDF